MATKKSSAFGSTRLPQHKTHAAPPLIHSFHSFTLAGSWSCVLSLASLALSWPRWYSVALFRCVLAICAEHMGDKGERPGRNTAHHRAISTPPQDKTSRPTSNSISFILSRIPMVPCAPQGPLTPSSPVAFRHPFSLGARTDHRCAPEPFIPEMSNTSKHAAINRSHTRLITPVPVAACDQIGCPDDTQREAGFGALAPRTAQCKGHRAGQARFTPHALHRFLSYPSAHFGVDGAFLTQRGTVSRSLRDAPCPGDACLQRFPT